MRTTLLLIILFLLGYGKLPAQQRGSIIVAKPPQTNPSTQQIFSRTLSEACNNNIDDDGNGLKDCEDYSCYYSSNTVCNCVPIDVIWIGDAQGDLFWINHKKGVETHIGSMGRTMTDITWAPDGNLYGVDATENKIWKIDPVTAQTTFVSTIPGYDYSNALTADGNGNLYIASVVPPNSAFHIIKLDLSTGMVTMIANLTTSGLSSAGDLAFYNGLLYVACDNNILANINVTTGLINSNPILGLAVGASIFGIVVKADGTIYLCDVNKLYKINIATMQASLYYTCTTTSISIWGMANFNDYCLAVPCATSNCECTLYVPTAFTPNNDGKNDLLKIFSRCQVTGELSIYNRWGELVYQTKDMQEGWNGIYKGMTQPIGIYVYQVKYSYSSQPGNLYKNGTFVLIR